MTTDFIQKYFPVDNHRVELGEARVCPERTVMVAVLHRAFWDLNYISIDRALVREAVSWFREKPKVKWLYSFQTIVRVLEYAPDSEEMRHLLRPVEEASEYLDNKLIRKATQKDRQHFARIAGHYFAQFPDGRNSINYALQSKVYELKKKDGTRIAYG